MLLSKRKRIVFGTSKHRSFKNKCIFVFYTEIHVGHQKWQENNSLKKHADATAYTFRTQSLTEIAISLTIFEINDFFHFQITLSCTISKINVVLSFMQKFKKIFSKNMLMSGQNRSILQHFKDKCISCRNSRWLPKIAGDGYF